MKMIHAVRNIYVVASVTVKYPVAIYSITLAYYRLHQSKCCQLLTTLSSVERSVSLLRYPRRDAPHAGQSPKRPVLLIHGGSSKTAFPRDKDLPCNMAVTQSLTENKPGVKLAPGEKNPLQNKSP